MSTFFTNIQSLFAAQYHGRYLGLILQEIGNRHSSLIGQFILNSCDVKKHSSSSLRFVSEFPFSPSRGKHKRRADLAVFDGEDSEPFALVEIKYFDKPTPESGIKPAQLTDYQAWRDDKVGRAVLVLSREQIIAPNLVVKRWNDLARHLKKYRSKHGELVGLLIDYLEEEGIVMQNVNSQQVIAFMKRIACSWKGSGRAAGNLNGPAEFSKLLSNMKLTAELFDPYFKAGIKNTEKNVNAAVVDFSITIRAKKSKSDDPEMVVVDQNKLGGDVWIYAQSSLNAPNAWMRFRYGVLFEIAPGNAAMPSKFPATSLFAEVIGKDVNKNKRDEDLITLEKISFLHLTTNADNSSEKVEAKFCSLLVSTAEKLLVSGVPLTTQQRRRTKKLCADLSESK